MAVRLQGIAYGKRGQTELPDRKSEGTVGFREVRMKDVYACQGSLAGVPGIATKKGYDQHRGGTDGRESGGARGLE